MSDVCVVGLDRISTFLIFLFDSTQQYKTKKEKKKQDNNPSSDTQLEKNR